VLSAAQAFDFCSSFVRRGVFPARFGHHARLLVAARIPSKAARVVPGIAWLRFSSFFCRLDFATRPSVAPRIFVEPYIYLSSTSLI
jgi:hypothetical protein